jgi:ABC-2 type transport system permease protein
VIARRTLRGAGRSGVVWGYVFGLFVVSSAWSYTSVYRTPAARETLARAFGQNRATAALFGPAPDLNTVNGFTVFKVSMTAMVIGAVWGLLTSSRLLRGEEESGRWDLLLAGPTTRQGATGQALAGLAGGAAALWAVTALLTAVAGVSSRVAIAPGPALFLALALVSPALVFLAVGALTSQLAATRRQAAAWAAVLLGLSYALRMVGDAGLGLHALTWLSPLGWGEELSPLTGADPWPVLLVFGTAGLLGLAAAVLAGRRDVGAGFLPDRAERAPRVALLGSPTGLALRLGAGTAAAWLGGLAAVGLLFGLVARSAGETLEGSSVQQVFARLGATGGGLGAYLGVAFQLVVVLVGVVAAGQVGAARGEEASGRLDRLLAAPVARWRWLSGRLVLAAALLVVGGLVAGVTLLAGASAEHAPVGIAAMVAAGLNAAVPALVLLGLGSLLLGVWPRRAQLVVYAVLAWSFLVELVGGIGGGNRWLLDTSLVHQVAAAPAVPVDWGSDAALVGLAVLCAVAGVLRFGRRDLVGA